MHGRERERERKIEGAESCRQLLGVRLTAAVLIGAVRAVWLFITLVTGGDAGAIAQAFKLLRSTPVTGTLGGCSHDKMEIYSNI